MRLMMQAGDSPNCLEQCFIRGLARYDLELHEINLKEPVSTLWHRALRTCAPWGAYSDVNATVMAETERLHPDVLWLFKGMMIYPETVRKLRKSGRTLVNFNADHPFQYFSRGSGNSNVLNAIPEYHLHLTYSHRIARELLNRFHGISVAVVPFGHEVDQGTFQRIDDCREIIRACFIGNPDAHRQRFIRHLVDAGVPVDVFGYKWDRFLRESSLLRLNGPVVGETMLRTLRQYRVQLNFFRPHNEDSHNMRTFEVPACAGIMLAEDSVEHRSFFDSGAEAFFFRSPAQMIECVRHLLAMRRDEADAIRKAARVRSVRSGYTYRDRAHQALLQILAVHTRRQLGRS